MEFRCLRKDEIDVRVGQVFEDGCSLLLYKDARVDMDILDETVGRENWQRKHYEVKGNLYCSVGVRISDTGEWAWKDDCGTESNTEKEKGESSDAFKRACVNWGIGRELYTAPKINIKCKVTKDNKGKVKPEYSAFMVDAIDFQDKRIVALRIVAWDKENREWVKVFEKKSEVVKKLPVKPQEVLEAEKVKVPLKNGGETTLGQLDALDLRKILLSEKPEAEQFKQPIRIILEYRAGMND